MKSIVLGAVFIPRQQIREMSITLPDSLFKFYHNFYIRNVLNPTIDNVPRILWVLPFLLF